MIFTHLLPDHFSAEQLRGDVAVVIDILRASTTITTAIANGAKCVIPCEQVEQAFQLRRELSDQESSTAETILGGERRGVAVEGFDFGNSPVDYSSEHVAGKTVLFTTTNGTRAVHHCREAETVLIGSFLNLSAVIRELSRYRVPIHLVCAGTDGGVTLEDSLYAGALAKGLVEEGRTAISKCDDTTQLCLALYDRTAYDEKGDRSAQIRNLFRNSQGGRNLLQLGMESDLTVCSQLDTLETVASWDRETNRINALPPEAGIASSE